MKLLSELSKKEVLFEIPDDKSLLSTTTIAEPPPSKRRVTDKCFLFIFAGFVLITVPLIIYTLRYADTNRLNGYDECGNVCGQNNVKDPRFSCSGMDNTNKTFTYDYRNGAFIRQCGNVSAWRMQYEIEYGSNHQGMPIAVKFALASLIPIGLSLILAIGFRYATTLIIIVILIISWGYTVALIVLSYMWAMYFGPIFLIPSILISIFSLCLIIFRRDRISLAIVLFRESSKAISNIKMLYINAMVTLPPLLILVGVSTITIFHMTTAGILRPVHETTLQMRLDYVPDTFMIAAIILTVILTFWAIGAAIGLQNMAVSGAVSKWYSSRVPVYIDFSTNLKYHVGTVIAGSLIFNLLSIPRLIFICLSQISILKGMSDWFLRNINAVRNFYIITAAQGTSFLDSTKRVAKLLDLKVADTVAVRSLGDFMIFVCHVLIIWVTMLSSTFIFRYAEYSENRVIMCCMFGVAFVCSYTIVTPIQVAYDTMFLCICEEISNEGHKHHSMTVKEYLKYASDLFDKKVRGNSQPNSTESDAV